MEACDGSAETMVGRFSVVRMLGEGGMGVVHEAHDPELDRRVAIKLLHPSRGSALSTIAREVRLRREAQAMARLSHPNVVAVYDVGLDGDRIFIAMELVDGTSLRRWQEDGRRTWRELVAAYLQAGRGLAAAHDAGVVHLDFKPDNVLVPRTGAIRVGDFGLARAGDSAADAGGTTSAVAGTPRYMAPEQWLGRPADARTDQFAFCVALWEALYGEHPFDVTPAPRTTGDTSTDSQLAGLPAHPPLTDEYWARSLCGRRRAPPRGTPVPARIARILGRGLGVESHARHPDLTALLDQLAAVLAPSRWRWRAAAAAAIVASLAVIGWLAARGRQAADPCAGVEIAIDGVWGPTQEREIARAMAATGRADAPDVARRVGEQLARYRDDWRAMRRDACRASRVEATESAALFDLRMQCLDRRLGELTGLVRALHGPLAVGALDRAIPGAHELTPIAACADTAELTAVQPLPPGASLRQAIAATESRLDDVDALRRTGAYRDALARIPALVGEARGHGYAPSLARALELHGWLLRQSGAADPAETVTRDAIRVAAEGHAASLEAAAWTNLLYVVGHMRSRQPDAAILRPAAEAAVARSESPQLRARLAVTLLTGLREQGASRDAEALAQAELVRAEAALGPDDLDVSAVRGALASAQWDVGKIDEALATDRQVLATRERVLGGAHPLVGSALVLIGGLLNDRGRYREARDSLERAIRILEAALGADHTEVATALNNLAGAVSGLGDSAAAVRIHERVLAIREKAFGPDSEPVAVSLNNLGQMLIEVDRGAEAEPYLRRSLAIREHQFGPDHEKVARTLTNLAWALDVTGRCGDAIPLYDRAIAISERAFGKEHERVASPLSGRGLCQVDRAPAEAIVALERATRLVADGSDPGLLAMTRFGLARALRKLGRDPERARALAEQARVYAAEQRDAATVARIETWLRGR